MEAANEIWRRIKRKQNLGEGDKLIIFAVNLKQNIGTNETNHTSDPYAIYET